MKKFLAVLGRQPELGVVELEAVFGNNVRRLSEKLAGFEAREVNIGRLGGILKVGEVVEGDFMEVFEKVPEGRRIVLGVSDYSRGASEKKSFQMALKMKSRLRKMGRGVRIVPNKDGVLSSATSHHNQLGEKEGHIELMFFEQIVAVLTGVQNITAYAARDQKRPARDARVGMLPPKLAQVMVNLAGCGVVEGKKLLDPFCGTGVVLQEALLMGYEALGTDLSERMVEMTEKNLKWLEDSQASLSSVAKSFKWEVYQGDAETVKWRGVDLVASESYLGQAFSAVPSEGKLKEVKFVTGEIIKGFLRNLAGQVEVGTRVCLAVPAWRRSDGGFEHLKLLDSLESLGYNLVKFKSVEQKDLMYFRDDQIVARELLVLTRK